MTGQTNTNSGNVVDQDNLNKNLINAIGDGKLEKAKDLLNSGTDINMVDVDGNTVLHLAITYKKTDIFKLFIEQIEDINLKNNNGNTALHLAVIYKKTDIVKLLIEKNADITLKNKYKSTALSYSHKYPEIKTLIQDKLNEKLMDAVKSLNISESQRYLENDANVNAKDDKGYTPLDHVFDSLINNPKNKEAIEIRSLLEKKGAKAYNTWPPEIENALDKSTALSYSHEYPQNKPNEKLMNAVKNNNLDEVKKLLNSDADVNVVDSNNKAPLDYVFDSLINNPKNKEAIEIRSLLEKKGAKAYNTWPPEIENALDKGIKTFLVTTCVSASILAIIAIGSAFISQMPLVALLGITTGVAYTLITTAIVGVPLVAALAVGIKTYHECKPSTEVEQPTQQNIGDESPLAV